MKYLETVPQPLLEQWLLGELAPAQVGKVEAALRAAGHDPALVRAELEAQSAQILQQLPFARLESRLEGARGRQWQRALPAFALAATAAAVALALWLPGGSPKPEQAPSGVVGVEDGTRLKGGSRLLVYRVGGQDSELLTDGAKVGPGEALQVLFQVEAPGCVAILSVDANGAVSRHFPADDRGCGLVKDLQPQSAPRGFVLDDSPGYERFFLLRSDGAFAWKALEQQLRAAGPKGKVSLGPKLEVSSLLLEKTTGGAR